MNKPTSIFIFVALSLFIFAGGFLIHASKAQAAISFVGSVENSAANGADVTLDLSTIVGLQQNDLVIVTYSVGDNDSVDFNMAVVTPTGYTEVADVHAPTDIQDVDIGVYWKIMGATPDSSVTVDGLGGTDAAVAAVAMAFRGVDTTTPMDVTPTSASANNTMRPNPPSIDHLNPVGVWTVIAGANGHILGGAGTYTFPTGYTTDAIDRGSDDTSDTTVGMGYRTNPADPEDPGIMIHSGTDDLNFVWAAATIALRPQAAITTLGPGTNPGDATIGPGGAATEVDSFTFVTNSGTDSITSVTTTLAVNTTSGISKVEITSNDGATVHGSTTDPTANSFSISLSGLTASTTSQQFKIRVTPKSHANMPAPPGQTYTVTSTITAWSGTNTQAGSDASSSVLTIDNLSPANVTNASGTAASGQVTLSWTNPADSDFTTTTVLQSSSSAIGSFAPTEGTNYATSTAINSTTSVACVVSGGASANVSCINTGLANGTAYHYKIFSQDSRGNYATGTVPTGSPLTPAAATITVSGSCKQFDQTTDCTDTGTVRVAVNGVLQAETQPTVAGTWTISGVSEPVASGDVITVFIDGAATSSMAVAVTKWVSGNITGVSLNERHLSIGSADNQTVTNANLSQYDNSVSGNAAVFHEVDGSSNLTLDINGGMTDARLLVRSGNIYQPDSSGAGRIITADNLQTSSTATLTANGSIFRLNGSFVNNGTFNQGTSTVEFSGSSSGVNCSSCTFYNLTASSTATLTASTSLTVSNTLSAVGILSIPSGNTVTHTGTTLTLTGTISGAGTLIIPDTSSGPGAAGTLSSVVRYDASSVNVPSGTFDARIYGGLVEAYASSASARTLTLASGSYTFDGGLNVLAGGAGATTLIGTGGNPTVDVNGTLDFTGVGSGTEAIQSGTGLWTVSTNADFTLGTYTASSSNILRMDGTGTLTTDGNNLWNFEINSAGTVTLASGATTTVSGNLTLVGAGTPVFTNTTILMTSSSATIEGGGKTINNLRASSTGTFTVSNSGIFVGGTLDVVTGGTLSISSGLTATASSSLILNGTISGAGRLTYLPATAFPITGNVSSTLRFDSTNNNQTISARTYAGIVEAFNSGGSARTLTMATGTYTLNSDLQIYANGSATTTLDGATNTATGTIAGSVLYSGSGSGNEVVTFSAAPWTISSGLNISNGIFTAPAGTLKLGGNYTNNSGAFTHSSGTLILNGNSQQIASGTLDGSSSFNNLYITNNSGTDPDTSPSIIFTATTTAVNFNATSTSVKIRFNASSTYAFTNINWNGQATGTRVALRSSVSTSTRWLLNLSGTQTVSNVDAKDSDASPGSTISALDGTNLDSGGNTNWDFALIAPTASSTADDVFEIQGATTTVSNINILSGTGSPGGRITSSSDIRVVIPSSVSSIWDNTVASITCASGNGCANIATSGVTYESSNKIAVINVLQNFLGSEWVQISGLKMGGFTAVNAATSTKLRIDGVADVIDDATDTRTKTIKGKLVLGGHVLGETSNKLDTNGTSVTDVELLSFNLVPTGENMTMTTTTIPISAVSGFVGGDLTSAGLFLDSNSNGVVDGGELQLGATGTTTIANGSGTIVFGGTWSVTSTSDIILRASVQNIGEGDYVTLTLPTGNFNATGATSSLAIVLSGSASAKNHGKSSSARSGGGLGVIFGGNPPSSGSVGGGAPGAPSGGEGSPPAGGSAGGGGSGGGGGEAP